LGQEAVSLPLHASSILREPGSETLAVIFVEAKWRCHFAKFMARVHAAFSSQSEIAMRGAIHHPTFSSCFVWRCAAIGGATDRTIAWQQNSEYPVVLRNFDNPRA
jgi:hypothetical protein